MRYLSNLFKYCDVAVDNHYFERDITENPEVFTQINSDFCIDSSAEDYEADALQIIDNAQKEAAKIEADARQLAEKIVHDANLRAESILDNAKNDGYNEGFAAGKKESSNTLNECVAEVKEKILEFDRSMADIFKENEQKMRILAVDIARKIINTELSTNSEAFINLYKNAAEGFGKQEWVKLSVSDAEIDFASANADTLMSFVRDAKYIDIIKLADAPQGTCIIETPQGIANASVDAQLEKVMDILTNADQLLQDE